ncbi:MAG TPA: septal ring lytic transglycosylase RlpA family protein [Stellaceae bacterium]|nr:septal ring lytic transglycosylase RlpA family protein [Stellaceae bacterium]
MRGTLPTGRFLNAGVLALGLLFGTSGASGRMAAEPRAATPPLASPAPPDGGAGDGLQPTRYDEIGIASWYGGRHQGQRTASGARFDRMALTAAHRSLPFGTIVLVENLANGRSLALPITDRGPYRPGRIIDLSQAAARRLGLEAQGLGLVGLTVLPTHASSPLPQGG